MSLIATGKRCIEIGKELSITEFTVRKHRNHISAKFDCHSSARLLLLAFTQTPPPVSHFLVIVHTSPREMDILQQLADGLTSKQIAKRLLISPRTVEKHLQHIKQKQQIHTLAVLIAFAKEVTKTKVKDG